MKLSFKFSFVIFFLLFVLSCSKDNTTDPQSTETMADYMPLTIGSWWKYEGYEIDNFGNRYNKSTFILTITGIKYFDGKNTFVLTGQKDNTDSIKEFGYCAIEDEKLLLYITTEAAKGIGWLVWVDFKSDSIILKDTTYITDSGGDIIENHDMVTLKKGMKKDFTVKNKIIQAQEFISEGIYITKKTKDGIDYFDSTISTNHNWFGKNVGYIYGTSTFKMSGSNYPWPYFQHNTETILIDYEIK
ncbi:MAG: hypothetical protein HZB41_04485 [Ignavibacteriae bacterium]|nr:hypothetical protein [Ignavibacteriota bacterium]